MSEQMPGNNQNKNKKDIKPPKPNGNSGGPEKPENDNNFWKNVLTVTLILVLFSLVWSLVAEETQPEQIAISTLASDIRRGEITEIVVEGNMATVTYQDDRERRVRKEDGTALSETLGNYGVDLSEDNSPEITIKSPSGIMVFLTTMAPFLIPLAFIVLLFWYLSRQVKGSGMQAFNFGQSKARLTEPGDKKQRVTFKGVAGNKEAKEELTEIVDFLKNPKKFLQIGARIPKGVLLMGPPGSGKTLMARAVAGEAGVPFFSISGSEFVEMFVGVGASRVRDLFKLAKKAAPAIIFVDEIDAVGRVRGGGTGGGNDEREQTLNQILVEMDGFEPNEKVIVMAATNRPDVLDPALLRPGRFDRRVVISLPDRDDRKEILKVHVGQIPLAEDVNLEVIADRTPGFSGADLYSLMNEGAILAARESRKKVSQYDLIRSIEKVMLGPERKSHLLSKKEKEITAYHEAGHAIIASLLPYADPVRKVSIISRGSAAGYVLRLPLEERKFQSKREFLDTIAVSLGGYVAEQMLFDDLTTGPSNDLQVSTGLARDMVTKYGMSEKIGPIALKTNEGKPVYGAVNESDYSEEVSANIDSEVSRIMNESEERAREIITEHMDLLRAVAKKLIDTETIEHEEFELLLEAHGVTPKRVDKNPLEPKEPAEE
ncbi:MAG: ATP-dependent zinc metalloprotease FtsH [Candidatus Campbellbacteria bacterium]|nr:ATP-dependent zinc metalloprotease FtsH [Candidatus Campbellbacteria bacterium]